MAEPADTARAGEQPARADRTATLARVIAALPLSSVSDWAVRAVRSKHLKDKNPPEPLYYLASARTGARYTPLGGPAGLYLANDQDVALAEVRDVAFDASGKRLPLRRRDAVTLVTVLVRVAGVLDLTDRGVRDALGVSWADLNAEWQVEMEEYLAGRGPLPLTQQIGAAAHLTGRVHAIRFDSARHQGGICLCVFPDRLSARDKEVVRAYGVYRQRLPP